MYDYFTSHLEKLKDLLPGDLSLNAFNTITVLEPDFKDPLPYKYTINYNNEEKDPVLVSFLTEEDMFRSLPEILSAVKQQNFILERDYTQVLDALEQSVKLLKEILVAQKSRQQFQFSKLEKQMEAYNSYAQHRSKGS